MIDRSHALPVKRQARELGISRGSVYYQPRPTPAADLAIMRRIDALHMDFPSRAVGCCETCLPQKASRSAGARLHADEKEWRSRRSTAAKHVETGTGHKIDPYLLRKLTVTRPNQVWATDITYIPMARGFVYLIAIVDWFSRRVLSWRLSITLETDFCIEALEER